MNTRVFITGINGQDGSYLAEYMLQLGYSVYGIVRRHSVAENQTVRLAQIYDRVTLYYGDMLDSASLEEALLKSKPHYVFHLAAQSHVRISFDIPEYTMLTNGNGTIKLLDACRKVCPNARIYNAASSEMFGVSVDPDGFQRETTPMLPTSPYGVSKVTAYLTAQHYRRAYNMHICNGILFNHESPRRGSNFVTQKIVEAAVDIKRGRKTDRLELGNLEACRDWGHAFDYVRAMWLMVNHVRPMDFVVASGETHSVREMCETVFTILGLNYNDHIIQNPKYLRPEELPYLRGDASKFNTIFNWTPSYTFKSLLEEMIEEKDKK